MAKEKSMDMYGDMPVRKAVLKNAVPAMIAMCMVLIYNLADTFFVSQTNDALQVAAVSLATPVFLLFSSVGTVFGVGGTSVISRAVGEGRTGYAKKVCAFCMWSCIAVGVIMSLLLCILMEPLLKAAGASIDTWDFAKNYLQIVILCGPFSMISNCYSNILRAEGQAANAMAGMVIGNLLNVVLDPVFILYFNWEIVGAAAATVIGNVAGAMFYMIYFLRGKSSLSINIRDFSVKDKICGNVLAIGIPAALAAVLMSVSQILANYQMAAYGDMALAGLGVALKAVMITGMICMGLGQGIQPLLGYYVGKKNWKRYKETLRFSLIFAFVVGVVLTGLCYIFVNQIVGVFLTEENAAAYGVQFTKILLCTNIIFGIYYVFANALQAMGAAGASLVINLSRQGFIYIPALFLFNILFGVSGIVWAQPAADMTSALLAGTICFAVQRKLEHKKIKKSPEGKIAHSV